MLKEFLSQTAMNLALAAVPPVLGLLLGRTPPGRLRARTLALGVVWLLFLPNAAYLATEWRHFLYDEPFTLWRAGGQADRAGTMLTALAGTLYLGYTLLGVVLFTIALRPVERQLRERGARARAWAPPLFLLVALGVYVGLVHRLNSWDVVHPVDVLTRCARALSRPRSLAGITAFAGFLWIAYRITGYALDGYVADRLRRRASRRQTSTKTAASPTEPRTPPAMRE